MNHRNLQTIWQDSPSRKVLNRDCVHVWCANLDLPVAKIDQLATFLSTDEIARASKFRFLKHKRKFIAARVILRHLLGQYLNISSDKLEFTYSDHDKPQLASLMGNNNLQFNISHSHNYALFGFTNYCFIGVDLEFLREIKNSTELSKYYFTHREFKLIKNLTGRKQKKAFFQLWTAKKAFLKAISTGLANCLTSIELSYDQDSFKLLAINSNKSQVDDWSMYHFVPAKNYIAAIVNNKKTPQHQIDFWNWREESIKPI